MDDTIKELGEAVEALLNEWVHDLDGADPFDVMNTVADAAERFTGINEIPRPTRPYQEWIKFLKEYVESAEHEGENPDTTFPELMNDIALAYTFMNEPQTPRPEAHHNN